MKTRTKKQTLNSLFGCIPEMERVTGFKLSKKDLKSMHKNELERLLDIYDDVQTNIYKMQALLLRGIKRKNDD
jgi:hypothetical protein